MNRFHDDFRLQVYMYYLIYFDTETMSDVDYFPDIYIFVKTY